MSQNHQSSDSDMQQVIKQHCSDKEYKAQMDLLMECNQRRNQITGVGAPQEGMQMQSVNKKDVSHLKRSDLQAKSKKKNESSQDAQMPEKLTKSMVGDKRKKRDSDAEQFMSAIEHLCVRIDALAKEVKEVKQTTAMTQNDLWQTTDEIKSDIDEVRDRVNQHLDATGLKDFKEEELFDEIRRRGVAKATLLPNCAWKVNYAGQPMLSESSDE
jgi:hypothetical protein